jgi:hypothetical protein
MLNCQFFPNSIMKINWSLEGLEIDPWLFDSDPPSPFRKPKNGRFSSSGIKNGNRRLSATKTQIPAPHSWYPDWRLWWTPAFTPSPSVRARSLSRNTTSDLARLWRENHAWCALWASRVWYMSAYFWTRKERSSPVCISLWFSRTCKNRGLRFSRPNLLQSVVVWICFKVLGFRNCSIVVGGKFSSNCLRLSKYFYAPRKMSFFWGLVSLGFRVWPWIGRSRAWTRTRNLRKRR